MEVVDSQAAGMAVQGAAEVAVTEMADMVVAEVVALEEAVAVGLAVARLSPWLPERIEHYVRASRHRCHWT